MKPGVGAKGLQHPRRRDGSDFKADTRKLGVRKQRGRAAMLSPLTSFEAAVPLFVDVTAAPNHVAARLNSGASDGRTVSRSA